MKCCGVEVSSTRECDESAKECDKKTTTKGIAVERLVVQENVMKEQQQK